MAISTLLCWSAFVYVVYTVDPFATNWVGLAMFYASLFLALVGTTAIIGFLIRFVIMRRALAFRLVKEAFRQSFLFSFLIIAMLFLLSRGLFTWYNIVLLAIGLTVLEFFLISYQG
jgi:hypothetical protein